MFYEQILQFFLPYYCFLFASLFLNGMLLEEAVSVDAHIKINLNLEEIGYSYWKKGFLFFQLFFFFLELVEMFFQFLLIDL